MYVSPFLIRLRVLERLLGAHGLVIDREREEVRFRRRLVLRGGDFVRPVGREVGDLLDLELKRATSERATV